jgi:molybdopterin-containing oxidoreductase family membrane subunit
MTRSQGILGIFSYADSTLEAIRKLKKEGFGKNLRAFSPVPNHEIEEELKERESIVRFFTLTGGTLGAICGLSFTILTSLDWPIMTSSKPIVSLPPYMIIVFELTVLLGGLSTLVGLLINARLRQNAPVSMYDPRFSEDKFGVMVVCSKEDIRKVEEILKSSGADEIQFEGI